MTADMPAAIANAIRRRLLAHFSGIGLGASLLPGVLWARIHEDRVDRVTVEMLRGALAIAGVALTEQDQAELLSDVNRNLERSENIRTIRIPDEVAPPLHFSPLVPGLKVSRDRKPFRMSTPRVKRPSDLEQAAFWPITKLAQLLRTRQVTSVELTKMYLARLNKYGHGAMLNCVVTLLEERALAEAKKADVEIAAGRYRGPLHGIPWGAKDLFAAKGAPTTWGSAIFKDRIFDYDAGAVEILREAGAVLVAKLTTAELAGGDDLWFGGQTKNPWDLTKGAGGSSSGSAAATSAGLVGFALGTETDGSILWPSARCGVTGLRPTFGRVSRFGVMPLSWTLDRVGTLCRQAEDCALVMREIARADGHDLGVVDIPFNWSSERDIRRLRVGYLKEAFDEVTDSDAKRRNARLIEQIGALGVRLVPVKVPDFPSDLAPLRIESAAFFDELIRSGADTRMRDRRRVTTGRARRVIPGVDYLQAQRVRMMLMMKLAEATQDVEVYFGPISVDIKVPGGPADADLNIKPPPIGVAQRHSAMANLATYPALAVPCGVAETGLPQSVTLFARPFGESELLAFAKAYQDKTQFHLMHPHLPGDAARAAY